MKNVILAAVAVFSLGIAMTNAQARYQTPPHNFYQNNWMSNE
jgi:hypothetical protein